MYRMLRTYRCLTGLAGIVLLVQVSACGPSASSDERADPTVAAAATPYSPIDAGRTHFLRYCASCHGAGGTGDGPVAAAIPIPVPDLTRLEARDGESFDEDLLRRIIDGRQAVIYHGTRYMPVWGYEFWVEEGADEAAEDQSGGWNSEFFRFTRAYSPGSRTALALPGIMTSLSTRFFGQPRLTRWTRSPMRGD